ncbi:GPP34 family phosphoprotein [Streptomyces sp. NPDC053048]|uniref:GOLPH3/VPS74 family protein n=1 Tax=Streptomyces sp. NPDC053048 TaxID=3365694 RepID=UPI0037D278EB
MSTTPDPASSIPGPAAGLTLPEELLLLAHHPVEGTPLCARSVLPYGMAGAVLAELELGGHVTQERGRPVAAAGAPPADQRLAGPLKSLPAPGGSGPKTQRWIRVAAPYALGPWTTGLLERGALGAKVPGRFDVVRAMRYPVGTVDLTAPTRGRFEAARQAGFPDPRSRALAGLVAATGLAIALYPGLSGWGERRQLRRHMRDGWISWAVYRNRLRETQASGGSSGGGHGCGGGSCGSCGGGGD